MNSESASENPEDGSAEDGIERRRYERFDTSISVDYSSGETFLFSYIQNISEMGIFIRSDSPLPVGTRLELRFTPEGQTALELEGEVTWINPYRPFGDNLNPGMGVRFRGLKPELRERIVDLVRTVAYLRGEGN
ncbi:MAG TPA: TIGR02266 family protein [Polyangiales bacterium]|nr:TIGR02266 family protein [Polyangiales bacterium]